MRLPPSAILALGLSLVLTACGGGGGQPAATVDAGTLPLMGAARRVGVVYSGAAPAAKAALDADFARCIAAGADSYQLSVTWASLESSPGVVDVGGLESLLATVESSGLRPYLLIKSIDTNRLALPADLVDGGDPAILASGVHFDAPAVAARFAAVLDQVVPRLVLHGGFYLAVGNEIDPWLAAHPAERTPFLAFVRQARSRAHLSDARLAVGATCTFAVLDSDPGLLTSLLAATDTASFTYYPLNADFTVRDPGVVAGDLARLVAALAGRAVLLQEAGYPAGYSPGAGDGSSAARQKLFVDQVFAGLAAQPRIRYCSFMHMADYTAADLAGFVAYYGTSQPLLVEYLATLGMIGNSGVEKPAFQALLDGLAGVRAAPAGNG